MRSSNYLKKVLKSRSTKRLKNPPQEPKETKNTRIGVMSYTLHLSLRLLRSAYLKRTQES